MNSHENSYLSAILMQVDNYGEPMKFIHYVSLGLMFYWLAKKRVFVLANQREFFISLQYWKRQISRFTMRTIIQTSAAPKAIGPYSQAVLVDRTLYISGQLGLCPSSMELIDGGADKQCRQALLNMGKILKAAGATYDDGDIENYSRSKIYVHINLNCENNHFPVRHAKLEYDQ
ncbi:Ribonuclease [Trichinella pseudospiralis]|uniref:Ribonuclease n=1 Tax=Trichinella pseudospiralis TaxID=6337 RepID=A0A0V1ITY0_TRIPS|nr:Ribonuclease [Trichinella pseudospiralis]